MENVGTPAKINGTQKPAMNVRTWFSGLSPLMKRISIGILILFALGLFIFANIFIFRLGKNSAVQKFLGRNVPTPTPTPYPINRHGKLSFTVASGKQTGPQFQKGFIDPYDVKEHEPQTIRFFIQSSAPVTSVRAIWKTDHKETSVPLTLVEGTATDGQWEGAWIADDTYWYTLSITAIASDGTEENKIDITLR